MEETVEEVYGCTICHQLYEDFIHAIWCCDEVFKPAGEMFYSLPIGDINDRRVQP